MSSIVSAHDTTAVVSRVETMAVCTTTKPHMYARVRLQRYACCGLSYTDECELAISYIPSMPIVAQVAC
jgi:hypothetical protein